MNNHNLKGCSAEFTAVAAAYMKEKLANAGIKSNSPYLASVAVKHYLGELSFQYQRYRAEQGEGNNWTYFPKGFSPYQCQRILNGQSAQKSGCIAVGKAFAEIAGLLAPELATDPLPLMGQLAAELQARVALARIQFINDLLEPPEFHYARFVPLKDKDIERIAVRQSSDTEAVIEAQFRDSSIQVGLIIALPTWASGQHSIVYAPQPYRWTGAEVVVGRKKIRSIEIKKDRIQTALLNYLKAFEGSAQAVS